MILLKLNIVMIMLIIARDTQHTDQLKCCSDTSTIFSRGHYVACEIFYFCQVNFKYHRYFTKSNHSKEYFGFKNVLRWTFLCTYDVCDFFTVRVTYKIEIFQTGSACSNFNQTFETWCDHQNLFWTHFSEVRSGYMVICDLCTHFFSF